MKGFWGLCYTAFLGAANDNFFKNAFVMLIAFKGLQVWGLDHKSVVALAGGIFILPYFLFSGLAGELADKWERSRLIRYIKFWELLIMSAAGLCFFAEAYDWLMLVLFCMGTQSTFFGPVKYSSIYDLSQKNSFVKHNAFMELATFVGILLGTIGGGIAAGLNSFPIIVGGIVLMAIVGIFTSYQIPNLKPLSPKLKLSLNPVPPSVRILKSCFKNKDVFWGIMAASWFWFLGACILALIPILAKDILVANENVATAFLVCFTLGIGIGSVISEKLSYGRVELALTPIGGIAASLFLLDLGLATSSFQTNHTELMGLAEYFQTAGSTRVFISTAFITIFMGIFIVPINAWLQLAGGEAMRSRVIAGNNIVNALAMVLSAVFLMFLHAQNISTPKIIAILGMMSFFISIIFCYAYPQFRLRMWTWFHARLNNKLKVSDDSHDGDSLEAYICYSNNDKSIAYVLAHAQKPSVIIYDRKLVTKSRLRKLLNQNNAQGIEDWANLKEMDALIQSAKNEDKQLICFFSEDIALEKAKSYFQERKLKLFQVHLQQDQKEKRFSLLPLWKVQTISLNIQS